MKMLYLDDYKQDEEATLRELGVGCVRLSLADGMAGHGFQGLDKRGRYEVRGQRLSIAEYGRLHTQARAAGISLGTSQQSFEIGGNFALQYPLLGDLSPGAVVANADEAPVKLARMLQGEGLRFPVFVRSEIESAAKFVGVDGCVINSASVKEIDLVVRNLRTHVHGFRSLIFKEMVQISRHPASGRTLEFRAIGAGGRFLLFDFDGGVPDGLPEPESLGLRAFAEKALESLAQGGADGGLFLDVAVTETKPIVVECKNLLNGTIKAIRAFGECLRQN